MKTSAAGRALIEQREGRRLTAYRDTKGILTIGVGHTGRMAPPAVTAGMTISEAQCDAFLAGDLAPVEAVLNTAVKVPMTQNEFDAMASLGFNIGAAGLKGSTVIKKLNVGDVPGAAAAFMNWSKPAVLIARRKAEKTQFLDHDALLPHDAEPTKTVMAARSDLLLSKAIDTKAKAKTTGTGGAAVAAAGATVAVATASTHHWTWALAIGALVVVGIVIDGLVVWSRLSAAKTLATNAASQAAAAAPSKPSVAPPPSVPAAPAASTEPKS